MIKRIVIIALAAAMALPLAGCLKKKNKDELTSPEETSSVISEQKKDEEYKNIDIPDTIDTPESPDFSQREENVSPFEFPYDSSEIRDVLEEYAEEKGLRYNGSLTMKDAKSVTKVETRSAVNGLVLEAWCKSEIDSIITLAKDNGLSAYDVEFNVVVYESSRFDSEYDITFYSK